MIPVKIEARPDDDGFPQKAEPAILPLPGVSRRPEREPASPRPAPKDEFGPRDVANALHYHSVQFVTLSSLLAAALGTAAWILVPAKYTTYAMVYVAQREPAILESRTGAEARGDFGIVMKTQAAIIKSTPTINGALNKPQIASLSMVREQENPVEYYEEEIKTEFSETSQVIKVMLTGKDPSEITHFVNAVVDYYIEKVKADGQYKQANIEKLQKHKRELEELFDAKQKHWEKDMGFSPSGDALTRKQRQLLFRFQGLQQEKQAIEIKLAQWREALKLAEQKLAQAETEPVTIPDLPKKLDAHPVVVANRRQIERLERSIADHVQRKINPYDATYHQMRQDLEQAKGQIDPIRADIKAKEEELIRAAMKMDRVRAVEVARNEVQALEGAERVYAQKLEDKEFQDIDQDTGSKPMTAEHRKLWDDIERYRAQIGTIEASIMTQKVNLDSPERIQIYDRAQVPTKREMKKQLALTGVAGLLGFGLVGGCISLVEIRRKRVYSPRDPLFHAARLPLLGVIPEHGVPRLAADLTRPAGTDLAGRAFLEAVDKLRTTIGRQMAKRKMQVLLVTSAAPDEGKSILAWNLALSSARSDKRTLFVDANLRNPGLHNHFEIASHPGLSEFLRGDKPVLQVVQRTALENLWCIAAGVCDDKARQALDKEGLRRLLDKARQDFDFVVLDACSIQEAVDPLYIAQRADGTVLSLRTFASRVEVVEKAVHRLSMIGAPLLGAVLTDATGAAYEM